MARLEATQLAADVAVVDVLRIVHAQMSGGGPSIGIVSAEVRLLYCFLSKNIKDQN